MANYRAKCLQLLAGIETELAKRPNETQRLWFDGLAAGDIYHAHDIVCDMLGRERVGRKANPFGVPQLRERVAEMRTMLGTPSDKHDAATLHDIAGALNDVLNLSGLRDG